ncbi:hypothetical protein PFISCL1PPCAC_18127, partial [Pristionchus fissidentatus]
RMNHGSNIVVSEHPWPVVIEEPSLVQTGHMEAPQKWGWGVLFCSNKNDWMILDVAILELYHDVEPSVNNAILCMPRNIDEVLTDPMLTVYGAGAAKESRWSTGLMQNYTMNVEKEVE